LPVQKNLPNVDAVTHGLEGRSALVTGSTSNIGRAIAVALAAEGAHVLVSGRDENRGAATVATIREAGGAADFLRADLDGSAGASHALARAALDLTARLDVLVNNAAVYPAATTLSADEDLADRIWAVNVKAPFFLTQAVVPGMIEAGGGVVVNLGSWIARLGLPVGSLYSASKGAMETLTRAWASEFGPSGVRVNAVSPGVIRPPELDPSVEFRGEALMASTPVGRAGDPGAIAAAVVYLASDEAWFTHGTVLDVDGGRSGVAVSGTRAV
jgi:NAD(P)-dependent dehydrogenase (short-subunit alcohol dehydrogenase family)